ncbi:hypothetical protein ACMFMG_011258 [Clarireedia jacksonii]
MTDWNKLKVVDLRNELKKRGLPQTGLKPALVARLTEAENEEGSESDGTIQEDASKIIPDPATSPDTISAAQPSPEVIADPVTEPIPEPIPEAIPEAIPETIPEASDNAVEVIDPAAALEEGRNTTELAGVQPQLQPSQPLDTTEASQPPSQPVEQPAEPRSAELSVEPQELIDDRQKRKRRSQSPVPNSVEIARKRAKPDEAIEEIETTKEDAQWVEKHNAVDEAGVNEEAKEVAPNSENGPLIVDASREEVVVDKVGENETAQHADNKMEIDTEESTLNEEGATSSPENSRPRDSRFKDLFSTSQKQEDTEMAPYLQEPVEDEASYSSVSPAIHPATSALYIRNFVRPLQESRLHDYLSSLATAPGNEPNPDVIIHFHIDRLRTHSIVQFTNLSAAARVRNGMHDRIWPDEPNRKPLWVDFIPEEKVEDWISQEQAAGTGRNTKKWEVVYEENQEDGQNGITAVLQEALGDPQGSSSRKQSIAQPPPSGPRGTEGAPSGPRYASAGFQRPTGNVRNLNEIFKATITQPTLYWQPVSKDLVKRRLDAIEDITTKDLSRHTGSEINRYTFEDGDRFVDRGPEIFSGIRPPPGHRGGRAGGGGGGGGGGYGGRGGGGGGYGGRGDRAFDRGYERGYDSYRAPPRDRRY